VRRELTAIHMSREVNRAARRKTLKPHLSQLSLPSLRVNAEIERNDERRNACGLDHEELVLELGVFEMSQKLGPCTPSCEFFRCGQRSLFFKSKAAWCKFADDECEVRTCKYAQCVRDRLLPNGVCALELRPRTSFDVEPDRVVQPIKAPAKLAQKLKERELY